MLRTTRSQAFLSASLTVLAAVVFLGLSAGRGHAQVPPTPTRIPGLFPTPTPFNPFFLQNQQLQNQALQNQILQQQALQNQLQNPALNPGLNPLTNLQIPTASPMPTITPIASVTPVATATSAAGAAAPSGATAVDACSLQLAQARGGDTITYQSVELTLPAGSYQYGFIRPEAGVTPAIVLCSMDTLSTIYLDARTGRETARRVGNERGAAVLTSLQAQVRASNGVAGGGATSINPPNTGDGGLR
jgi:hypothetical protein